MIYKMAAYYIADKRPKSFYYFFQDFAHVAVKWHKEKQGLAFVLQFQKRYPPVTDADKDKCYLAAVTFYNALGLPLEADSYFRKHVAITDQMIKTGELKSEDRNALPIAEYYYKKKEYTTARNYLEEYLKHPSIGYPYTESVEVYMLLAHIDSLQGNYAAAFRNLNRYATLKDSIFTIAKSKQIEELQLVYQTAQKQKEMAALKNEQKFQQIRLSQAENTRNWMLAGSILLVALLCVSYRAYRIKQKGSLMLSGKISCWSG